MTRRAGIPYKVGDWFAVPLRDGKGYALGRIARAAPRGKIIFCYFFGPPLDKVPKLDRIPEVSPQNAVFVARCGDLGLIKGDWPIIGSSHWDPDEWKMPQFSRTESISGATYEVTYRENDPSSEVSEQRIDKASPTGLPENDLFGYGAVEIRLTKLLRKGPGT
jgi:hypothetical protein